jgi:hypothetical protein
MVKVTKSNYDSSWIQKASYNHSDKTLFVILKSGSSYLFSDISKTDFDYFNDSNSQGSAFNKLIKNNYTFKKIH